jgi:hypothetical protein
VAPRGLSAAVAISPACSEASPEAAPAESPRAGLSGPRLKHVYPGTSRDVGSEL